MKRWVTWLIVLAVAALLAAGIGRALAQRKAQQQALAASAQAPRPPLELTTDEIWPLRPHSLAQGIAFSGSLRAVQSAAIKARVAGELQGLALREGDSVQAGQEVARIDPTEFQARWKQAQEQAEAAQAQVTIQQRQLDNNTALVKQGFISPTALESSQANWQAARSSYQAALAAADVARKALQDTVLRSPISGQIAQRLVQNGERVAIDTRILEVVDLSRLEIEALLPPSDAVAVRVGQTAQFQLDGDSQTLSATVVRISPNAQAGSRAVPVYLSVQAPNGLGLRQGLFVQGRLTVAASTQLAVPVDAVRTDKPTPYVQIATAQNTVAHRPVVLGQRGTAQGQTLVAVTGLAEGSLVLAGRVGSLPEGTALRLPTATAHASTAPPKAGP